MTVKAEMLAAGTGESYRELPSVNDLLLAEPIQSLLRLQPRIRVVQACRAALDELRDEIAQGRHSHESLRKRIAELPQTVQAKLHEATHHSLRPVINATGVLLHTNLGRAPLSRNALEHAVDIACGYCNLEFDLDRGDRGTRDTHVESSLLELLQRAAGTGSLSETHRAILVNNCAAATYLALHALTKGREVLVSRGELVEIGGGFRIPEILYESGAVLREVGTTNRTRVIDYQRAITGDTGMILRVHQSNFSMDGFVERPSLEKLVELGKKASIPVFEDQGTGLVCSLEEFGISSEPTLLRSVGAGCDLVAASGDKLFGGPQCGILVGKAHLIDQIRKDPLFRTYRVDKLSYAALEATLHQYLSDMSDEIPILRMLRISEREIERRCAHVADAVKNAQLTLEVVAVESVLGGGTAPRARLKSFALSLKHVAVEAENLLRALRRLDPPVIGRIDDGRVVLDLRTVEPGNDTYLIEALNRLLLSSS
jgi:L-seryl-tRNA(Ser) seleniumtransferase